MLSNGREVLVEEHLHYYVIRIVAARKHDHVRVEGSICLQAFLVEKEHSEWAITLGKHRDSYEECCDYVMNVTIDENDSIIPFFGCLWPEKRGTEQISKRKIGDPIKCHEEREGGHKRYLMFSYRRVWHLEDILLVQVALGQSVCPEVLYCSEIKFLEWILFERYINVHIDDVGDHFKIL